MATGLAITAAAVAAVAMVAVAVLPVSLAADDCFTNCFKHCVANDKSMTDYCNYACGMTCGGPDGAPQYRPLPAAALAAGGLLHMNCQLACVRESCYRLRADGEDMEACYGHCYDGCNTKKAGMPRPLRAGAGPVWPAALPDHPFHEMQDDAIQPTSEPDPDDVSRRARGTFLP